MQDQRLIVSGAIFGAATLLGLLAAIGLRWWLIRSTRTFDQQNAQLIDALEDPKLWAKPKVQ